MSNLPTFGAYAAAFEEALQDDDWGRLEQYFSPDASYLPGDGTEARGRDAVLHALRDSVNRLERKSDTRDLLGEPELSETGDSITLKFCIRYTRQGLPDLTLSGREIAHFSNGSIVKIEDVFDDPSGFMDWRNKL